MENQIRIVKIINTKQLVINAGRNKDINVGDKFEIIDKLSSESVIDPETGEDLGSLYVSKGYVTVSKVFAKMALVESRVKEINTFKNLEDMTKPNYIISRLAGGTRYIHEDLNVDPQEITGGLPAPSETPIKIGDQLIKIN